MKRVSPPEGIIEYLDEITICRLVLIILLVFVHSFAIYSGSWVAPVGFVSNIFYKWIAKSSYSIMLESFVMISGYLWAFQREEKGKKDSFKQLIWKKANRLLVPSLVFSCIYVILFNQNNSLSINAIAVLEGAGHLWFLPMLFWCFLISYAILQLKCQSWIKIVITLLLLPFSAFPLPLRLSNSFYYLFFFLSGYFLRVYKSTFINPFKKSGRVLILWIIFILTFVSLSILTEKWIDSSELQPDYLKYSFTGAKILFRFIYSSIGVFSLWITAVILAEKSILPKWLRTLGGFCMGVYIFHQFIIKFLIYYTNLPQLLGFTYLPWCVLLIALAGSLVITHTVKSL